MLAQINVAIRELEQRDRVGLRHFDQIMDYWRVARPLRIRLMTSKSDTQRAGPTPRYRKLVWYCLKCKAYRITYEPSKDKLITMLLDSIELDNILAPRKEKLLAPSAQH